MKNLINILLNLTAFIITKGGGKADVRTKYHVWLLGAPAFVASLCYFLLLFHPVNADSIITMPQAICFSIVVSWCVGGAWEFLWWVFTKSYIDMWDMIATWLGGVYAAIIFLVGYGIYLIFA